MNTLPLPAYAQKLITHGPLKAALEAVGRGDYPLDCSELEAPLAAVMAAALSRLRPGTRLLVVVSSDAEAEAFAADCELLVTSALVFPWWKAAA